jgi:hypothetical protein
MQGLNCTGLGGGNWKLDWIKLEYGVEKEGLNYKTGRLVRVHELVI